MTLCHRLELYTTRFTLSICEMPRDSVAHTPPFIASAPKFKLSFKFTRTQFDGDLTTPELADRESICIAFVFSRSRVEFPGGT